MSLTICILLSSCRIVRMIKGDQFSTIEQMDRRAFRSNKYKKNVLPYSGYLKVIKMDSFSIVQLDSLIILMPNANESELALLESRLIPSRIFYDQGGAQSFYLHNLNYIKSTKHTKRIGLVVYSSWYVTPKEYRLELKNKIADNSTSLSDFIKGAELTYLSTGRGWL